MPATESRPEPGRDAARPSGQTDPASEYRRRLAAIGAELARRERSEKIISGARLATMVVLLVVAWLALQNRLFSALWALVPLAVFLGLVAVHRRVLAAAERGRLETRHFEEGLARIEDRWHGTGPTGSDLIDPEHPYAADLDLFGESSLFQLLCTCRTASGRQRLASWLIAPAERAKILARQEAVEELRAEVDFRERLWRLGERLATEVEPEHLLQWAGRETHPPSGLLRGALAALAAGQLVGAAVWAASGRPTLLLALLLVHSVAALVLRGRVKRAIESVEGAGRELTALGGALRMVSESRFHSARLVALRESLESEGRQPATEIRRLERIVDLLDSRRNPLFVPLAILLVWTPQLALVLEAWRARTGPCVATWIEVAGELEALAALSGYAYEHPADPYAEIVPDATPLFDGEALAHPLAPAAGFVPNDLHLDEEHRALVVSGSNMSGKSTFLRTVGINAVLAQAGAPVRARRLRLSTLAIGASIQVHDSLQEGHSRFFAEILRLRRILEIAREGAPTLFLLDEILHGTNSHDRRLGAEAVIHSLLTRCAIGLVTTHDLALARIADDSGGRVRNVHFEDQIVDGRMVFDYRLRDGVVRKSNAIALMREVGLEV